MDVVRNHVRPFPLIYANFEADIPKTVDAVLDEEKVIVVVRKDAYQSVRLVSDAVHKPINFDCHAPAHTFHALLHLAPLFGSTGGLVFDFVIRELLRPEESDFFISWRTAPVCDLEFLFTCFFE